MRQETPGATAPAPGEAAIPLDSGLGVLLMMAALHGIAADRAKLRHEFGHEPFSIQTLLLAAHALGMKAQLVTQSIDRLDRAPLPAIAVDRNNGFFILARYTNGTGTAAEPSAEGKPRVVIQRPGEPLAVIGQEDFLAQWSGQLIFLTSKATYANDMAKFDFTWFVPAVVKYRKLLGEVLLISLVLQIIGLATPMFFQVVMDKVLVNHAMKTLNVIAVGLICAYWQYGARLLVYERDRVIPAVGGAK